MTDSQGDPSEGNGENQISTNFPHSLRDKYSLAASSSYSKLLDSMERIMKINQKRRYFDASIFLGISWIVFTGSIICANGMPNDLGKFSTSDSIVIALISSSVISPLILIGKSLFDRSKD